MKNLNRIVFTVLILFCGTGLLVVSINESRAESLSQDLEVVSVRSSIVNIRSGPGTEHDVVTQVHKGDKLKVLSKSSNWYQIKMPDGKKGWIYAKLVRAEVRDFIRQLKDKDIDVRRKAVIALGKTGSSRAVTPLIAVLKDKDLYVIQLAAWALGETKDKRAVTPLIAALRNKDSSVRYNAAEALGKITGKDFGQDQAKWHKWWETNKEKR